MSRRSRKSKEDACLLSSAQKGSRTPKPRSASNEVLDKLVPPKKLTSKTFTIPKKKTEKASTETSPDVVKQDVQSATESQKSTHASVCMESSNPSRKNKKCKNGHSDETKMIDKVSANSSVRDKSYNKIQNSNKPLHNRKHSSASQPKKRLNNSEEVCSDSLVAVSKHVEKASHSTAYDKETALSRTDSNVKDGTALRRERSSKRTLTKASKNDNGAEEAQDNAKLVAEQNISVLGSTEGQSSTSPTNPAADQVSNV